MRIAVSCCVRTILPGLPGVAATRCAPYLRRLPPLLYTPLHLHAPPSYVLTGMLGISISYHRQLSHKSFRCVKPLEYFFAYCGALAFEGDPIEWVGVSCWVLGGSGVRA